MRVAVEAHGTRQGVKNEYNKKSKDCPLSSHGRSYARFISRFLPFKRA